MDVENAISLFVDLSAEQKTYLLARFGHELTIDARAVYVPETDDVADPKVLRRINEAQHRVFGLLMMLHSEPGKIDAEWAVRLLLAYSPRALEFAYESALKRAIAPSCDTPARLHLPR